ncbi:hypothetical protein GUITHDRAFT_114159 [Guillardia theta CCMP2712]|uniref:Uncharacterized protein n=1 Tax=Guillardia theta (strain CCMP2712) TaxID=905079 RepID=L1IU64_GUITC|nr:hypothetical protein GUITHDRAFT_114159 [Guillardia theta CCMP2712]EKX39662.1 hypothetical protein GUITHDRAFT_114159 [Guillardia theta CCMP2712]|eukprot:XP_005826642.1 hypothetical protein GUITHDRAFT_114159 [Guillardia theta CCMP2712]
MGCMKFLGHKNGDYSQGAQRRRRSIGMRSRGLRSLTLSLLLACAASSSMHVHCRSPVAALALRGGNGGDEADVDPYDPLLYQQLEPDAELEKLEEEEGGEHAGERVTETQQQATTMEFARLAAPSHESQYSPQDFHGPGTWRWTADGLLVKEARAQEKDELADFAHVEPSKFSLIQQFYSAAVAAEGEIFKAFEAEPK